LLFLESSKAVVRPETPALELNISHVVDNEKIDKPDHNNVWHDEDRLIAPSK
jgi:hypothetical protein